MQRALVPWPGLWSEFDGKILKLNVSKCEGRKNCKVDKDAKPGTVCLTEKKNELAVVCGKGVLIIDKLQLEGKREMKAKEFLQGYKKIVGSVLG